MTYFDVETTAAPNAAEFIPDPKPPGSMKKADTIAEWERTEKPKLIEQALADAALSPLTGMVLAIGVLTDDETTIFDAPEDFLLQAFWTYFTAHRNRGLEQWVGFNSSGFDWPFLVKRSWIVGVKPARIFDDRGYLPDSLIDLRKVWCCGDRQAHGSLDVLCRLMGLGSKTGSGADFGKLYLDMKTREQALEYLRNDLALTRKLGERIL